MALSARSANTINTAAATERYERLDCLGEGTYGVVYRARDRTTGKIVALKKTRIDHGDEGIPQTALREVSILQELRHPNIVNLLDVICADAKLYLIFEFARMDLKKALQEHGPVTGLLLKRFVYQLLDGLCHCHQQRIVHRDLKPANILVDDPTASSAPNARYTLSNSATLKIADFGLARAVQLPIHTYTHEVVTLWYRAPEILLGETHYLPAVDMWSIGCIMAEMVNGQQVLFRGDCEFGQLVAIFQVLGTPNEGTWPGISRLKDFEEEYPRFAGKNLASVVPALEADGVDLLRKMLAYSPQDRISAKDAMNHRYFDDIRQ